MRETESWVPDDEHTSPVKAGLSEKEMQTWLVSGSNDQLTGNSKKRGMCYLHHGDAISDDCGKLYKANNLVSLANESKEGEKRWKENQGLKKFNDTLK